MSIMTRIIAPFRFPSAPDVPAPQPYHKYPDLPLFKSIWSPAAFQDMSLLTWSYRITLSAMSFMFVALLVDAVIGNLYRYTFGNLTTYLDNERFYEKQKIYIAERNRALLNCAIAALGLIGIGAAIYYARNYFKNPQAPHEEIIFDPSGVSNQSTESIFSRLIPKSFPAHLALFLGIGSAGVYLFRRPSTYFDTGEVLEGTETQNDVKDADHACTFISYYAVKAMLSGTLVTPEIISTFLKNGGNRYKVFTDKYPAYKANNGTVGWTNAYVACRDHQGDNSLRFYDRRGFANPAPDPKTGYHPAYQPPTRTLPQDYYESILDPFYTDHLNGQPAGTKVGAILTANGYTFSLAFTKEPDNTEKVEFFDSHGTTAINNTYAREYKAYKITFSGANSRQKLINFLNKRRSVPKDAGNPNNPLAPGPSDYGLYPVRLAPST